MSTTDAGVTADDIVLICQPNDEDDVKCGRRFSEKFGHQGFNPYKTIIEFRIDNLTWDWIRFVE